MARILLIEDSPTEAAVMVQLLERNGHQVTTAANAEDGIASCKRDKPDLVLMDIILPGMNGFGALRAIRKNPSTQHVPVIMISGNEHATEQFYANRIGADDFMKKPFSRHEIFARIEALLDAQFVPRRRSDTGAAPAPMQTAPLAAAPRPPVP